MPAAAMAVFEATSIWADDYLFGNSPGARSRPGL
jgi:hypothetical protein